MDKLVTFVVAFGSCFLSGIVVSLLWGWFMVPIFHLPGLNVWASMGISTLANIFSGAHVGPKTQKMLDENKWGELLFTRVFEYGFLLLFGYVCHAMM